MHNQPDARWVSTDQKPLLLRLRPPAQPYIIEKGIPAFSCGYRTVSVPPGLAVPGSGVAIEHPSTAVRVVKTRQDDEGSSMLPTRAITLKCGQGQFVRSMAGKSKGGAKPPPKVLDSGNAAPSTVKPRNVTHHSANIRHLDIPTMDLLNEEQKETAQLMVPGSEPW
eukprot:gene17024-23314_t